MPATTKNLPGDWRRRSGTRTQVHLWVGRAPTSLPECGKRIPRAATSAAAGAPCTDCLVWAIRKAGQA
jgi:hypothetical protein